VLPQSCQDLLEVAADASRRFRAAPIPAAAGLSLTRRTGGGAAVAVRGSRAARPAAPLSPRIALFMLAVAVAVAVRDVDAAGARPPRCPLTRRCPVRARLVCSGASQDPGRPLLN
jgi:hypothetical protein